MAVSMVRGWSLFFRALAVSRFGSLAEAAEWMYRLNVFARSLGRHPIVDEIYEVKNELIKYFYQHGYSIEVTQHNQKRECYPCNGTGEYWTGEPCWKCDGTGVFAVTKLYAFRFEVKGRRFAWHQLEKFIDYPVTLTDAEVKAFSSEGLRTDAAILSIEDAWLGVCVVWWSLFLRGKPTSLSLFRHSRLRFIHFFRDLKVRFSALDDDVPF